jgi:hypothetical protein
MRTRKPAHSAVAPVTAGPGPVLTASGRLVHLDNLKVVLIALIIAMHAILGYVGIVVAWTYSDVRETTLHPVVEMVLLVLLSPFGFFLIALLFLVAGLLTPGSHDRKGGRRFVLDRLLRLGVPFALYVFLVQPTLVYLVEHPLGGASGTYWQEYLGSEQQIDTGPLWFVGVLLLYSLAYAVWRRRGRDRPAPRPPTLRTLVVSALVVAPTSFVIRLVYPYGGESGFTDLNLWEWPACIAVFVIGVRAAGSEWLRAIPEDLVRTSRRLTAAGVVAMTALLYVAGSADAVDDMLGGWHVLAVLFACVEAVLVVFGPVWLLDLSRRRLDRHLPWGEELGRSAYGAFMLQAIFLLGLAVAVRPVPFPAEAKAVLVALGGVVASFGAAWLLIRRVPGVSRIL